jgi:uncharacterized protein (TIGR02246 family)
MSQEASKLVAAAKEWATYYGKFTTGEEGAVLTAPLRARAAWDNNDAAALAEAFIENGSWLAGDEQLRGREEIRAYLAAGFEGPYKGSRWTEEADEIKFVTEDVALAITTGGVLYEGETELPEERAMRVMWVCTKRDGYWHLVSHQSSPIKG